MILEENMAMSSKLDKCLNLKPKLRDSQTGEEQPQHFTGHQET